MASICTDSFPNELIVGSGIAGLRAALEASKYSDNVKIISKLPVMRSHSVSAAGGINSVSIPSDSLHSYFSDTIKGSDMIGWEYVGPFDELEAQSSFGGYPFVNDKLKDQSINAISCHKVIDGGKDNIGNDIGEYLIKNSGLFSFSDILIFFIKF